MFLLRAAGGDRRRRKKEPPAIRLRPWLFGFVCPELRQYPAAGLRKAEIKESVKKRNGLGEEGGSGDVHKKYWFPFTASAVEEKIRRFFCECQQGVDTFFGREPFIQLRVGIFL